jgi:HTH-type transcriptional regulator/antitoxin HipB
MSRTMDYALQTPRQLSAHLRALREARGFAQAALGERLGVGQTRVARIAGNPTAISVAQLVEVLGALGVQMMLRDDCRDARVQSPREHRLADTRRLAMRLMSSGSSGSTGVAHSCSNSRSVT